MSWWSWTFAQWIIPKMILGHAFAYTFATYLYPLYRSWMQ